MAPLFGNSHSEFSTKVNNGYGSCPERGSFHESLLLNLKPPRPPRDSLPKSTQPSGPAKKNPPSSMTPTVPNLGWHSTHHGASWEDIPREPETKGWLSVVSSHDWAQSLKVKPQRPGAQIQQSKGVFAGMFTISLAACYCPIDDHQRF